MLGPAEITGIVTAVTALIGAISTFIYKVRGRSWREVFQKVVEGKSEEFKELSSVAKAQANVVKSLVEKELKQKGDGKRK